MGRKKNLDPIRWEGEGVEEVGIRSDTGEIVIKVDKNYFRPTEVETYLGIQQKRGKARVDSINYSRRTSCRNDC